MLTLGEQGVRNAQPMYDNILSQLPQQYRAIGNDAATKTVNGLLGNYMNTDSTATHDGKITSALKLTTGNALNSLGQRGVLNSSVTTSAMNNITRNAADVTAQNYLNNINTLQGLAQIKWQDTITTDRENTTMTQQKLGNTNQNFANANTKTNSLANLYNQQANWNAYGVDKETDVIQQRWNNAMATNNFKSFWDSLCPKKIFKRSHRNFSRVCSV